MGRVVKITLSPELDFSLFSIGFLPEMQVEVYTRQIETREGRAALSLHILMHSVEDAHTLPVEPEPESLNNLRPERGSPPHLRVIRN